MGILTEAEHARIADAIRDAESRTAGEIFAVLAASSDSYRFIPLLWAALATLFAGIAAAFLYPLVEGFLAAPPPGGEWLAQAQDYWGEGLDARTLAAGQIVLFLSLALLASLPGLRPWLIPGFVRRQRAERHAMQQFLSHNLHGTSQRTGILIFVSLAERYAAVIADEGINAKVDQAVWDELVERLIADIRAGDIAEGLLAAVASCGDILAEHVPASRGNPNELPDNLVEL
ncbi:TPM domain-containing protein [Afifella pfennigii]|uniref:TPM domain-containing protein n=1 Tax=Afifella pfennigii TaxID=209897 RepID=UPI000556C13A|nr:TPM domain-containing protein [Afifella pfennigii]